MQLLVLSSALLAASLAAAAQQSIGVRGQLMCGNAPLTDADVKLWLLHTFPRPDTQLATVKTDSQGRFQVSGTDSSMFTIDPAVRFYHRCNNKGMFNIPNLCQRESTYNIPASYISQSGQVQRWYDMGTMNMEAKQKGEETHCASNPIRAIGRR
ncbi:hypothetical protein PFISCL1PPCAC_13092 [Pristionchus fissidentatus]|uniref:Transthyretin-like family protein n=1 Tax=Pristionchus fissidentatus TaxID=1538716 RepID=A0AAV5VUS5_9BILA|nr:hypothetical protein PFISCL1PPCAC_13092 [Pristionchus fissidentatus]